MFKRRRKLLEPRNWAEFINKEREVNLLRDTFRAARGRRELPGHILLFGPPGCGKTTLGKLLCGDSIWPSKHVAGPAMEPEVLIYLFRKFRRGVLLIDEIHGLKRPLQEMLLPVMSEGRFFFGDTSIEVDLCLIGTTTSRGLLLAPLRDRFALEVYIAPYNTKEIRLIVTQAAEWLGTELTFPGGVEISRWARGVPTEPKLLRLRPITPSQAKEKIIPNSQDFLDLKSYAISVLTAQWFLWVEIIERFRKEATGVSGIYHVIPSAPDRASNQEQAAILKNSRDLGHYKGKIREMFKDIETADFIESASSERQRITQIANKIHALKLQDIDVDITRLDSFATA